MSKVTVSFKDDNLILAGELTQETVMLALEKCKELLPSNRNIQVDLSAIDRCDSASLAFLTALLREAKTKKLNIGFTNMPTQMLQIGRVSGLDDILPLAEP